jgi:hypothetical protein
MVDTPTFQAGSDQAQLKRAVAGFTAIFTGALNVLERLSAIDTDMCVHRIS